MLGYSGTVSFAHTMFYGIGSYAIAIALYMMGPTWGAVATGISIGLPLAALLALGIGLFSLRVQAIFFAMITLAVASAFLVLASQLSWLTGGDDGRSFRLPELLRPGTVILAKSVLGFEINGRTLSYYIVFVSSGAMILALLRIVNSPFGRVLQAIRENRFRAEALGYRTVFLQAAPLAFMLKDRFMPRAGFQQVLGNDWFQEYYVRNDWGVDDRAFLEQAAAMVESLAAARQPWFLTLLSVGTHHPFILPPDAGGRADGNDPRAPSHAPDQHPRQRVHDDREDEEDQADFHERVQVQLVGRLGELVREDGRHCVLRCEE